MTQSEWNNEMKKLVAEQMRLDTERAHLQVLLNKRYEQLMKLKPKELEATNEQQQSNVGD